MNGSLGSILNFLFCFKKTNGRLVTRILLIDSILDNDQIFLQSDFKREL